MSLNLNTKLKGSSEPLMNLNDYVRTLEPERFKVHYYYIYEPLNLSEPFVENSQKVNEPFFEPYGI